MSETNNTISSHISRELGNVGETMVIDTNNNNLVLRSFKNYQDAKDYVEGILKAAEEYEPEYFKEHPLGLKLVLMTQRGKVYGLPEYKINRK